MPKDVIIALDFENRERTLAFLDQFKDKKPFVKIGMELFYAEGPDIVREIKGKGHRIFLDLKLHDIPNTVRKAMRVLSKLDVDMTNLHAAGTIDMMQAALEGLTRPDGTCATLLAVTQLTSTDEARMREELLINATMQETVANYAMNAKKAGLGGVVPAVMGVVLYFYSQCIEDVSGLLATDDIEKEIEAVNHEFYDGLHQPGLEYYIIRQLASNKTSFHGNFGGNND